MTVPSVESLKATSTFVFFVNGRKIEDKNIDPEWTLLYYIRKKLRLSGTKLGCSEGGCGACTVMVSKVNRNTNKITHLSVNACLSPLVALHGLSVTTVEGIGNVKNRLHPVQERIAKGHGSQCGFCTPGIVMSMYTLLRNLSDKPSLVDLEDAFQGNLCRCTGYRPIIEAFRSFTKDDSKNYFMNGSCARGAYCCKKNGYENKHDIDNGTSELQQEFGPYDPTQELIFPPELAVSKVYDEEYLVFRGSRTTWYRPRKMEELIELKERFPNSKLVNGNTEIGIEMKFKNCVYPILISASLIEELKSISVVDKCLKVGSAVTISELEAELNNNTLSNHPEYSLAILQSIKDMLKLFAGKQIRNVGTIGGNIMTGSPISDLNPIFMAANCKLDVISKDGMRQVRMDKNFWISYRKNIVKNYEILLAIYIPFTEKNQYFKAYKQSKRRDDDIAIVNAAYFFEMDGTKIVDARISYGGLAPTTVMAVTTCSSLLGLEWNNVTLEKVLHLLSLEFPLHPGAPGGMVQYRKTLSLSFFFKFYLYICNLLNKQGYNITVPSSYKTATKHFETLLPQSSQFYFLAPPEKDNKPVGRPIVHQSAFKHATGEAVYCDDMPNLEDELFLCLVKSTRTYAKLISIDSIKALQMEGVIGFFSAKDIPKDRNTCGSIVHDEEVFASEKVLCQGQVIGALAASSLEIAQRASELIKVEYEDLHPAIITTDDAIAHSSYFPDCPSAIEFGNVEKAFAEAVGVVEGELKIGGQEHFYLETQNAVAIPSKEDDEITIYSATQHPSELQRLAAHILGIPRNKVVCRVKRIGGGFGGKEARSCILALPAAFAAYKLKRPVRLSLERKEDMMISGQRHPFYGRYRAGYTNQGKITAVELDLYSNAGCSLDLSGAVMERAMHHFSNGIKIPNIKCRGFVCKTNLPSNTAFRGFGAPQAMLIGETIIHQVGELLDIDIRKVHEFNFYTEGDLTHFNQRVKNCKLTDCWNQCLIQSNYEDRVKLVQKFNSENRFHKRGISIIPTMFGVGFSTAFLNQAGALVLVYSDGSVLLTHGGTEMGQGLHTKMIQVASQVLKIPVEYIHISETSTDKVPNTSATAASSSSDLNGMAVKMACEEIRNRLQPIIDSNPKVSWKEWVNIAYFQRISLAATGFYRTPNLGVDPVDITENIYNYFSYGAACSEVEIDCLTGDHQVIRTDIVMDLGESLNPAIDIGQIEGAFMQGYGLFTLEELIHSSDGILLSTGPGNYKIPGFSDIPAEFNVTLLKDSSNPVAVYSSKAVGEPPLFLASSAFFAIREAIKAARVDVGISPKFTLNSPATAARIRMACEDEITLKFSEDKFTGKPWNIEV